MSNYQHSYSVFGGDIYGSVGILPGNNNFSAFFGMDFNRLNKGYKSYQLTPSIGYSVPAPILKTFKFKFGYNTGLSNRIYNSWMFGVNYKGPVLHYLKSLRKEINVCWRVGHKQHQYLFRGIF